MNKPTIVAIDPGVNGGIAVFTPSEGTIELHKMPGTDWDVVNLIKDIHLAKGRVVLYLEEPSTGGWGPASKHSIGKLQFNVGILYGAAIGMGWEVHRVKPAIWMKTHPVGIKGDRTDTQWKNVLKSRAAELFPSVDVTLWNADALLILDAAKRGAIN